MDGQDVHIKPKRQLKLKKNKSTYFDKVTHLYLQEKSLSNIPKLSNAENVQAFYIYSNNISKIENLENFTNLTSLYLQNNQIDRIDNLTGLPKLKKLYLSKNRIGVLEGLVGLNNLEELYIEKQDLADNAPFCFDPRTIASLSKTLQILNISHNRIISLKYLSPLEKLVVIDASFNDLDDIKDVTQTLRNWFFLKHAKFNGNPISKQHRYREDIIANGYNLELLDNKNVSELNRMFIKGLEEGKMTCKSKHSINVPDITEGLPKNYPVTLQKEASASLMNDFKCKALKDLSTFTEAEPVYLSWNLCEFDNITNAICLKDDH